MFKIIAALLLLTQGAHAAQTGYLQGAGIRNGSGLLKAPTTTPTASRVACYDGSSVLGNCSTSTTTQAFMDATSSVQTQLDGKLASGGNAVTATALASNPSDCSANQYATAIAANGNLTCAQPSTANITEVTNLFYTDARARAAVSGTAPISYDSGTGAFSCVVSSGSAAGCLASADWTTFNNKQAALGFTAENVANKATSTSLGSSDTLYPSQNAVKTYADTKEPALGNPANNGAALVSTTGGTRSFTRVEATNVASAIVSRDGSGNVAVGGGTFVGTVNITADNSSAQPLKVKSSAGGAFPIFTATLSTNTDVFHIWNNGLTEILGSNGIVLGTGGSVSSPGLRYNGDSNTGWASLGADTLSMVTGGVDRLQANNSRVDVTVPVGLKSYTTAGLPTAATAGQIAWVSDAVPPTAKVADGTAWQDLDQNITCDSGSIANAQILTLNSAPVTLTCTAALGSGYAWQVKQGVAYEDYNGTAYATNTTLLIVPCASTGITLCTFSTMLTVTADTQRGCGPTTTVNAMQDNGSLCAFVSTGDPTGGTAGTTLRVRAYVRKVPYPLP